MGPPRVEGLYVTVFVSPAPGESFWSLSPGVSNEDVEAILALFAQLRPAGRPRILLLGLDNAGGPSSPGLVVPEGIRLVSLPPSTPELQPAETLGVPLDEPIANRPFDTLADLDAAVARQGVALTADRDRVRGQAGFHWGPGRVVPN